MYNAHTHVVQCIVYVHLGHIICASFFELLFRSASPPYNSRHMPQRGISHTSGKGVSSESTTLMGASNHNVLDFMGPSSLSDCDGALRVMAAFIARGKRM